MKIEEISKIQENGKYACNSCGKEYARSGISTHYWLRHGGGDSHLEKIQKNLHEIHESKRGKPSWNSGLTASTDERVAKSRETLKKRVEEGTFFQSRIGVALKDSTKEKLSEARSRFLNERGNGGFRDVKWFKTTDSFGNECSLRGSWERDVADWLNQQGIMWTRKHYVKYLDDSVNRTYSPDFFIPSDNTIIEVKGYYSDKDKRKMKLVQDQHPSLIVKMIMKKEIEKLPDLTYNQL
jgi:hypothetical protein